MFKPLTTFARLTCFYLSFFMMFWCDPVLANPSGSTVVSGSATFSNPSTHLLQINQQTQRAIIDWQQFSIASGETTKFVGSGNYSTLNRVTGGNLSEIYGNLRAENLKGEIAGNLYLLNPNGVLIGSSGWIDVHSFIASTLNVNNSTFMGGGDLIFKGDSTAEVKNLGAINAHGGDVFLIGRKVSNHGTIRAPEGVVGLAAGAPAEGENLEVLLKSSGSNRIFIRVKKKKVQEALQDTEDAVKEAASSGEDSEAGNLGDPPEEGDELADAEEVSEVSEVPTGEETPDLEASGSSSDSDILSESPEPKEALASKDTEDISETEETTEVVGLDVEGGLFEEGLETEEESEAFEYVWEALDTESNVGQIASESVESELNLTDSADATNPGDDANAVDATDAEVKEASILNTGVIQAVQAELRAVGGNAYALAINNAGEIRATGIEIAEDGTVSLVAKSGEIENSGTLAAQDASGDGGSIQIQAERGTTSNTGTVDVSSSTGVGGEIQVLGENVEVLNGTLLDASGSTGGGEILVGGDELGGNPEIQNAVNTLMEERAVIQADALDRGEGGRAILYAENRTDFLGTLTARGGVEAGNGGFIETSGKNFIQIAPNQSPDASARSEGYQGGEWLIDPNNISIVGTAGTQDYINNSNPFVSTGDGSSLGVDLIENALTGGTSVTITTGSSGSEDGDISWNTGANLDFNGKGSASLKLDATRNISFEGLIYDSDTSNSDDLLNVEFLAGGMVINSGTSSSYVYVNGTAVSYTDGSIFTHGGDLKITGTGGSGSVQGVKIDGAAQLSSGSGAIIITGTGGSSRGVVISGGAQLSSGIGGVTIAGTGGNLINSSGVKLSDTTIQTTGSALNITATSSRGNGVELNGSNTVVESDHSISISGSTSNTENEVVLKDNALVKATGSANITLAGVSNGIKIDSSSSVIELGSGTLTLEFDKIEIVNDGTDANFLIKSTDNGSLIARPKDNATAINLGVGASDSGFHLSETELGEIGGFGSLTFGRSTGSGGVTIGNVDLTADTGLLAGSGGITVSGDIITHSSASSKKSLQVTAGSANITFSGSIGQTVHQELQNLNVTTTGNLTIGNSSSVNIDGNASIDTGGNLQLSGMNIGGNLNVLSGGDITQYSPGTAANAISVSGNSNFEANKGANNLNLNNSSNQFTGRVSFKGNEVTIHSASDLNLSDGNASANLNIDSLVNITQESSSGITVGGNLNATADGGTANNEMGNIQLTGNNNNIPNVGTIEGGNVNINQSPTLVVNSSSEASNETVEVLSALDVAIDAIVLSAEGTDPIISSIFETEGDSAQPPVLKIGEDGEGVALDDLTNQLNDLPVSSDLGVGGDLGGPPAIEPAGDLAGGPGGPGGPRGNAAGGPPLPPEGGIGSNEAVGPVGLESGDSVGPEGPVEGGGPGGNAPDNRLGADGESGPGPQEGGPRGADGGKAPPSGEGVDGGPDGGAPKGGPDTGGPEGGLDGGPDGGPEGGEVGPGGEGSGEGPLSAESPENLESSEGGEAAPVEGGEGEGGPDGEPGGPEPKEGSPEPKEGGPVGDDGESLEGGPEGEGEMGPEGPDGEGPDGEGPEGEGPEGQEGEGPEGEDPGAEGEESADGEPTVEEKEGSSEGEMSEDEAGGEEETAAEEESGAEEEAGEEASEEEASGEEEASEDEATEEEASEDESEGEATEEEGSEEEGSEEEEATAVDTGEPVDGTDTSSDDQVMLPGETISIGGADAGPPPVTLNTATTPEVRSGLGNTNTATADVPPPPATPVPPPVAPAPPALDVMRAVSGQTMGLNFGGPPVVPPPQIQVKLDFSTGPNVMNALGSLPGF